MFFRTSVCNYILKVRTVDSPVLSKNFLLYVEMFQTMFQVVLFSVGTADIQKGISPVFNLIFE